MTNNQRFLDIFNQIEKLLRRIYNDNKLSYGPMATLERIFQDLGGIYESDKIKRIRKIRNELSHETKIKGQDFFTVNDEVLFEMKDLQRFIDVHRNQIHQAYQKLYKSPIKIADKKRIQQPNQSYVPQNNEKRSFFYKDFKKHILFLDKPNKKLKKALNPRKINLEAVIDDFAKTYSNETKFRIIREFGFEKYLKRNILGDNTDRVFIKLVLSTFNENEKKEFIHSIRSIIS
jgi:hypothetical protein